MAVNEYIVIWEVPIHVNGIKRQPGEQFEEEETQELKNLVLHKYLMKVKKVNKTTKDKKE